MTSVPRLFEKIYARGVDSVEAGSPLKKKLVLLDHWCRQATEYRQKNRTLPSGLNIKYTVANKLVFSKLLHFIQWGAKGYTDYLGLDETLIKELALTNAA